VVVRERATLKELGRLASTGPYIAEAPLAIVVVIKPGRFAISDGSRAIQDMMLVAWSAGVGSNWVGFGGMDEVKTQLGIPAELDILAILPFGYPAGSIGQGQKERKPLDEIVHWERW
jgi:nitroreductase